jgi:Ca-activated chloride channel family protein
MDVDKAWQTARRYLARSAALEGLRFQEATGYWANTYVPGDPAMRLLDARLSRWDRRGLGGDLRLEKAAHQNWQPFDPPRNAALALYLHADQAGVQGRTRMRVQVGLKGTPRQGGLRPAMNLALVLDLRTLAADDTGTSIRALAGALQEAHQPGDRFSITVAGRPGALLVPAQAFRHGPIQLAMKALFGGEPPADEQTLDLMQALTVARSTVQASDDPTATLGTSVILLVTASALGAQLPALERFAHQGALEGIPLSVAALGDAANIDEIDRLVRAGQGNRRILRTPDEATSLVQRELSAVSRVVARAVRLRIRLAPHVKLVQVLGSRRLDTAHAQRVRQAERSIDQRMARNLGIKADRGEDEEGIQIVIPSFFAGDAHVVLLDVVAERPGFIADAQVRYKDLVFLRNGMARTGLAIGEGERDPGPLQLRVLKDRLAMELAVSTRQAGHWLARGDPQRAVAILSWVRDLLQGMRYEIAGWSSDPDLGNDVTMVAEYLAMLNSPVIGDATERSLLADSLRYAAHRRLLSVAQ